MSKVELEREASEGLRYRKRHLQRSACETDREHPRESDNSPRLSEALCG